MKIHQSCYYFDELSNLIRVGTIAPKRGAGVYDELNKIPVLDSNSDLVYANLRYVSPATLPHLEQLRYNVYKNYFEPKIKKIEESLNKYRDASIAIFTQGPS